DEVCSFLPTHVFQHHCSRENDRTRIYFILTSILGSCTVSCFKDCMTGDVVDVCSGSNTNTTYDGCERIRDIVTVEVQRSHYRILIGTEKDLLQECISN